MLLVLASTAVGAWVMSRADDRVPMYAARSGLVPGQPLSADEVVREDVLLSDAAGFCTGVDLLVDGGFTCW